MGWALKSSQTKKKRFNDKQKQYLTQLFNLEEATGHKANAADVAKSMMTAKDNQGEKMFSSKEFLTARQITSFFSRLARKRKLPGSTTDDEQDDDDMESAELEDYIQELSELVVQEVALKHPITFDCYDICELISNGKISKFAIPMLKDICTHLDIDVSDIKIKRKKPYVDKLNALYTLCPCQNDP